MLKCFIFPNPYFTGFAQRDRLLYNRPDEKNEPFRSLDLKGFYIVIFESIYKKVSNLFKNRVTVDRRRNVVALTRKGKALSQKIKVQSVDVEAAIDGIIAEARYNLWEAIAEWEFLLEQKSLYNRVLEQKKRRESKK